MMRPMGARALVKRLPEPRPESSLIIQPETATDDRPSKFALVLAIGKLVEGGFDVGSMVILKDYSGAPCTVDLDGEEIDACVVDETDVLCVVEDHS